MKVPRTGVTARLPRHRAQKSHVTFDESPPDRGDISGGSSSHSPIGLLLMKVPRTGVTRSQRLSNLSSRRLLLMKVPRTGVTGWYKYKSIKNVGLLLMKVPRQG